MTPREHRPYMINIIVHNVKLCLWPQTLFAWATSLFLIRAVVVTGIMPPVLGEHITYIIRVSRFEDSCAQAWILKLGTALRHDPGSACL
jgi:hypothetical protein